MQSKLEPIKLLLLDVDGVLTDGGITLSDGGEQSKTFHVRDGHGLKLLQRIGVQVGIITGRSSQVVELRAAELGISLVYQGVKNKLEPYQEILAAQGLSDRQIAYVGDDIVDLPILRRVGFAATVADADAEVLERVDFISRYGGGRGAVREICELIIRAQGRWAELMARYLAD